VFVALLHAWHFLAFFSGNTPRYVRYPYFSRSLCFIFGVAVFFITSPKIVVCWLVSCCTEVIQFYDLPIFKNYELCVLVLLIGCLTIPTLYPSWIVGCACVVWGFIWQYHLSRPFYEKRPVWLWCVFSSILLFGALGLYPLFWWSGGVSSFLYTLLFTGRYVTRIIHPSCGVSSGSYGSYSGYGESDSGDLLPWLGDERDDRNGGAARV